MLPPGYTPHESDAADVVDGVVMGTATVEVALRLLRTADKDVVAIIEEGAVLAAVVPVEAVLPVIVDLLALCAVFCAQSCASLRRVEMPT